MFACVSWTCNVCVWQAALCCPSWTCNVCLCLTGCFALPKLNLQCLCLTSCLALPKLNLHAVFVCVSWTCHVCVWQAALRCPSWTCNVCPCFDRLPCDRPKLNLQCLSVFDRLPCVAQAELAMFDAARLPAEKLQPLPAGIHMWVSILAFFVYYDNMQTIPESVVIDHRGVISQKRECPPVCPGLKASIPRTKHLGQGIGLFWNSSVLDWQVTVAGTLTLLHFLCSCLPEGVDRAVIKGMFVCYRWDPAGYGRCSHTHEALVSKPVLHRSQIDLAILIIRCSPW